MEEMTTPIIDWGVAYQSLDGAEFSGDAYVVKEYKSKVLVAAIDGLGHGKEAAEASNIAVATLSDHLSEDIVSQVRLCHEALIRTRGTVMSIALFNASDDTMTWLGVGNVDGLLFRNNRNAKPDHESLFLSGGVIGYQLPPLRPSIIPVNRGDTLIFSTDGIRSGYTQELDFEDSPQRIAEAIITNFNRKTDDALAIVVRYTGRSS
jgi:phosphoserine phosphatase RsbX